MKIFIQLIVFMLFAYMLKAQSPIIGQSSLPVPGDTFAYIVDKTPTIPFNYNQTNATWNFAGLQNDSVKFASYGITSQLSFASSFPNSNLYTYGPGFLYGGLGGGAPYPNNYGYMLFSSNANGFYTIGFRSDFGAGTTNVLVQPNELLMKTPFTYGDSIFQSSTWEILFNNVPTDYDTVYRRYTYKYLVATGYGTLITPYGNFNNSLAVKEYVRFYDTIEVKYGTYTITKIFAQADTILNVHVWSSNKRNNLLTAHYDPHTMNCLAIEYLNYEDLNVIPENNFTISAHQFPNPLRSGDVCHTNFKATHVHLYNSKGQLIYDSKLNQTSFTVPFVKSGSYLIQFSNNKKDVIFACPVIIINE